MNGAGWFDRGFSLFKSFTISPRNTDPVLTEDTRPSEASVEPNAHQPSATDSAVEAEFLIREQAEAASSPGDCERRRETVRELFNDFWNGAGDKPPTFAERLDAAEDYINNRLTDLNFDWRLDAATRKQLGLPGCIQTLHSTSGLSGKSAL